jgi:hypothetical protein
MQTAVPTSTASRSTRGGESPEYQGGHVTRKEQSWNAPQVKRARTGQAQHPNHQYHKSHIRKAVSVARKICHVTDLSGSFRYVQLAVEDISSTLSKHTQRTATPFWAMRPSLPRDAVRADAEVQTRAGCV